jgi:molybdopterin synthase catalytic subunit
MIEITENPIDTGRVLAAVAHRDAGANLLFVGTTRARTGEMETVELRYESYEQMAERELNRLRDEAMRRWNLFGIAIVHRIGTVLPGEASMAVAVSSAHRDASFEAGQWLIAQIKQVVPVWKQEVQTDGSAHWVHPDKTPAQEANANSAKSQPRGVAGFPGR